MGRLKGGDTVCVLFRCSAGYCIAGRKKRYVPPTGGILEAGRAEPGRPRVGGVSGSLYAQGERIRVKEVRTAQISPKPPPARRISDRPLTLIRARISRNPVASAR